MTTNKIIIIGLSGLILAVGIVFITTRQTKAPSIIPMFKDDFSKSKIIEETGDISQSNHTHWWLNSGARLSISNGTAKTIHGSLSVWDMWRQVYARSSSIDTDNGAHPQNIFRLVQRNVWQNYIQEVYFKINQIQTSSSPNRNESNGVLLFNRYIDGDNLYYGGLRVDGNVVIKKKYKGTYYTLGIKPFQPNTLPLNMWVGIRTIATNNADSTVTIKVFVDLTRQGVWTLALETIDDGVLYGGPALTEAGHAGIRTDFMDVEFDDYLISEI